MMMQLSVPSRGWRRLVTGIGLAAGVAALLGGMGLPLLAGAPAPVTTAKLKIATAAETVIVDDNGPSDGDPTEGVIFFTGTVGGVTTNVFLSGITKPISPGSAHMTFTGGAVAGPAGANITYSFTDTGFAGPVGGTTTMTSRVGGTQPTATFQSYVDPSNAAFGLAGACTPGAQGPFTTVSWSNTTTAQCVLNGSFSMTMALTAQLAPNVTQTFGADLDIPVPVCGAIGDYVWNDVNGNGIQEPGELGINGVTVRLHKASDNSVIATTTTGNNPIGGGAGYYQFDSVCAGSYYVVVDQSTVPPGLIPSPANQGGNPATDSNPNPAPVTLATDGASDQTIDFGFYACSGEIGDFVWHDLNHDGIQDGGEPGIDGVVIKLYDATGTTLIATTTTASGGKYKFSGLCQGTYVVVVDSGVPAGFSATITSPPGAGTPVNDHNGSPATVTLPTNFSSDLTIDFGYQNPCNGAIGDYVWYDQNQNGLQDPSETGIDGVQVKLFDATGSVLLQTATTGVNPNDGTKHGFYKFTGLCAGSYKVRVEPSTVPSQFIAPTTPNQGSDTTVDSNPIPSTVVLSSDNSTDYTIDFGYVAACAGQIGDFVWLDSNQNGIQDGGELGIPGVTVNLRRASDNFLLATTTTGSDGKYKFTGLCPGSYKVEVIPPTGMTASPTGQGTPAIDSNPNPFTVTLTFDSEVNDTIDFGFYCTGIIGDFVWEDLNRDGIQTAGEPGIPNVLVTLQDGSGNVLKTTTTNAQGLYQFTGMCGGNYKVVVSTPAGYTPTTANASGSTTANDCNPNPALVTLPSSNSSDLTIDFGFYRPAQLGDFVWNDANSNGLQDSGEPGIGGVTVTLYSCANVLLSTTATNASGLYLFSNLAPGCYVVHFALPAGYTRTTGNAGTDGVDSDATVGGANDGRTGQYTLASGQSNLTVDAGFIAPPPPPVCVAGTYDFTGGSSSVTGTTGNIRTFSANGISVHVSAFGETKPGGVFSKAYLGHYSHGLGVTDSSENGSNDTHVVDNTGQNNYVMFEFAQQVFVDKAYLDYIVGDSDVTVWIGNITNAYNSHVQLNAAVLAGLGFTETNSGGSSSRWADLNAGGVAGNVLVIAAKSTETSDGFKLAKVAIGCPTPGPCVPNEINLTGSTSTSGTAGNIRTFSAGGVSVKASAWSRVDSTGAWGTGYLGSYAGGLGVTDGSEGDGSNNRHKVDNIGGRDNYVLFEFSQPVLIDRVFLDSIGADSDVSVWVGTKTDPFNNHQALSDSFLTSLGQREDDTTTSTAARWANVNASGEVGNILVVAALENDDTPEDEFKISKLEIGCPTPPTVCKAGEFALLGNSATSGTAGNVRTFVVNGVSVKVTAFSRDTTGAWATAYAGAYSAGMGVTDSSEGDGSNDRHKVDNSGRNNYLLFEFSTPVVVNQVFLDYIGTDSDISVWIGTKTDPFNNHLTLSDALLTSLGAREDNLGSTTARWADINASGTQGNVLVISAKYGDTNDAFKVRKIDVTCK